MFHKPVREFIYSDCHELAETVGAPSRSITRCESSFTLTACQELAETVGAPSCSITRCESSFTLTACQELAETARAPSCSITRCERSFTLTAKVPPGELAAEMTISQGLIYIRQCQATDGLVTCLLPSNDTYINFSRLSGRGFALSSSIGPNCKKQGQRERERSFVCRRRTLHIITYIYTMHILHIIFIQTDESRPFKPMYICDILHWRIS